MKRHVNCYFSADKTTDDVPSSDAMDIADITPNTDNAYKRILYKRVRSNMIAMAIKNNLTSESWCRLMLKKEEFTWTKLDGTEVFDGPTFIWVILTTLKPMRNVGMLDAMEFKFNQIKDLSGKTVFTTKQFTIQ
eukprot:8159536-Ditylum_brightwellii.AAC.1